MPWCRAVDRVVADRLAGKVVGDRPDAKPVTGEQLLLLGDVRVVVGGALDIEVVPPTRDLEAVVPPAGGPFTQLGERHVCPLTSEQGDGSIHRATSFRWSVFR